MTSRHRRGDSSSPASPGSPSPVNPRRGPEGPRNRARLPSVGDTFALLLAAGSGTRMGRRAKALLDLGGFPMFIHAYRSLAAWPGLAGVVILVPEANVEAASACLESELASARTVIAAGGETRQASVRRGLEVLPQAADSVLCHDAARPFASP